MTTRTGHHELSFNSGARDILDALYAFEEKDTEKKCPPKKPRSTQQEVKAAARKGGESPRKKKTC